MTETGVPHQTDDEPRSTCLLAIAIGRIVNNGFVITIASGANPLRHHLMVYRAGGDTAYNRLTSDIEAALLELARLKGADDGTR